MKKDKLPKPAHKFGYTRAQVDEIITMRGIEPCAFWEAWGVNTCVRDPEMGTIYYPVDIERALWKLGALGGRAHLED